MIQGVVGEIFDADQIQKWGFNVLQRSWAFEVIVCEEEAMNVSVAWDGADGGFPDHDLDLFREFWELRE
jgi:hypothetical protein